MYQVNFCYYRCVPKEAWGGLHVLIEVEVISQGVTAHDLTGVSPGGGTGATMSDGEDDYDSDYGVYEANMDPHDSGGFGPLVPTESERTLMERVRQELKYELKQVISAPCPSMGKHIQFRL